MRDGGPAFPCLSRSYNGGGGYTRYQNLEGMSLLEYYAGQALVGHGPIQPGEHYPTIADGCVRMAEALVARLNDEGADDMMRDDEGNLVWRRDIGKGGTVRISVDHWRELQESAGYHVPEANSEADE